MEARRVAGLDVHKQTIVACVLNEQEDPGRASVRTFPAHTRGLMQMCDWLREQQVTAIAMESTGVYWKPVYAVLEDDPSWRLVVGNAQHIKNVPGRKTDVKDAQWIAHLLRSGLIRPSFVPPPEVRKLRDLTRYRTSLVEERARERNRVHKVLQSANIKLDGVATDIFGASGMAMLHAMAKGTHSPRQMAELAKGLLRNKLDALEISLEGRLVEHHRQMLGLALRRLEGAERDIAEVEGLIEQALEPYREPHRRLQQIPGVSAIVAAIVLAEMGPDMSVFPSAGHAASWAGICPGNYESAGKRQSGRTTPGNRHLKTALCQAANAASRKRGSYLKDKFYRLKARRGHKRAVLAIGHEILLVAYHMLATGQDYRDLGEHYLDQRDKTGTAKRLVRRLEGLGYKVTVDAAAQAPLLPPGPFS
jgi:transposase